MRLRSLLPSPQGVDPVCRIFVLGIGNRWPAAEFLAEAADDHPHDFQKLFALLSRSVEHGLPANIQKVRQLKGWGGLCDFKAGCLRLFFFHDKDRLVICTHGIVKKRQDPPQRELKLARQRMLAYRTAAKSGVIPIIES